MSNRRLVTIWTLVIAIFFASAGAGWIQPVVNAEPSASAELVDVDPIPADAITVCEDCELSDLQQAIDDAPESSVIVVEGGSWLPITISKPIRIVGEGWPLIDAQGEGSGIVIASDDVTIEGFDIRNTGRSFDKEDSGIYFEGERNRILNNRMTEVLFGVNGATGHDSEIAGNYVEGQSGVSEGLRGDGIKVWYSHRVQIHHNRVHKSRDLLVWYSNECDVYDNVVTNSRYGFHFMNSDDGFATHNEMVDNSVGIYIMYGKRFTINNNLLQGSRGPSGHGLGLKEVDGFDVSGNVIYDNRIGVYNDNSPFSVSAVGIFHRNLIAYNDIGVGAMPSARANLYYENAFVENLEQVTVLGGGELSDQNVWSQDEVGNYWSDYSGYDSEGDGIGDMPYRNANLSEELRRTHPQTQLFRFSLAETAIDFAAEAVPLFETKSVLEDPFPLVKPLLPEEAPEVHQPDTSTRTISISIVLILGVAASMWWAMKPTRAASKAWEVA